MIAYFDTNPVDHLYRRQASASEETEAKLLAAIAAGRLVVPFSVVTAEELLSAVRSSPDDAFALGRLYLKLAPPNRRLKQPRDLLNDAILAYATRQGQRSPYEPFTRRERELAIALSTGHATADDVLEVTKAAREQIMEFRSRMEGPWDEVQTAVKQHKEAGNKVPKMLDLWPHLAGYYAEGFAGAHLRACRKRGIKGLLERRQVLAAVGGAVGLVHAQAINGRHPDDGDSRDLQHLIGAAAAEGLFVTDDDNLRKLAVAIPGLNLETVSLERLAARL